MPAIIEVLEAISNDISFSMLDIINREVQTIESLANKLNLSKKQCYDRIVKFLNLGLIKRKGINYVITSFGRLIFDAQLKVAKAVQNLSKLKMIDAVRDGDISRDEYATLIAELIEDDEIKDIILKR